MAGVVLLLLAVVGAIMGTLLNFLIAGMSQGRSFLTLPVCRSCGEPLSGSRLVPIAGYIASRGRCTSCGSLRPPMALGVEIASALLLPFLTWQQGPTLKAAILAMYGFIFIILFAVDMERRLVPNKVIYPSILVAPITAYFWGLNPISILTGGLLSFGLLLFSALIYRGSVGGGDIKLALFIGLVTGYPTVLKALFLTSVLAGLVSAFLLITRAKGRRDYIPFAPFMVIGTGLALLFG